MKKIALMMAVCIAFTALPAWADAPETSLFFTTDEVKQIVAFNAPTANAAPIADVHLGAVLLYGNSWTVWLQGKRVTSAAEIPGLQIVSVASDAVHLLVNVGPDRPARSVVLRPHQTFEVMSGQIVEANP